MADEHPLLDRAVAHATRYLDGLPDLPAGAAMSAGEVLASLSGPLADQGVAPIELLDELVAAVEPGLVACAGPRYFGFVTGGLLPIGLAVDWLTSTWDQNGALEAMSPAAAAVEAVTLDIVRDLLALPATSSGAVVVGAQAGNTLGVTVAHDELLRRAGWDSVESGLIGAPAITVVAGEERHLTMDRALRFAGLGRPDVLVPADAEGTMHAEALRKALDAINGPILICAQAGNLNSGAFDPLGAIVEVARAHDAWVHVDGAFGLWAAASPTRRHLTRGLVGADSWVVDGHKWLNTPYDGAFVFCADADAHRRSMTGQADYLPTGSGRDPIDWSQDSSRRPQAFALYASLRSLGRTGVADLVDRCCDHAVAFASAIDGREGITVRNDVVLNQVVADAGDEERTRRLIDAIQADGTCWLGPTIWQGRTGLRISVSNWSTTRDDIIRSADQVVRFAAGL